MTGNEKKANATDQPRAKRRRQKQVEVTGYVERTLKERVRVHAQREGLSESEVVRTALREFFFPRRNGQPQTPEETRGTAKSESIEDQSLPKAVG